MTKHKVRLKTKQSSGTDKVQQRNTKTLKRKKSFKKWFKLNKRKILLVSYYSGATIVIASSIYVIMSNITKTEDVTRDEPISFFTEYIDDNDLELGTEEVEREGEDGVKKVKYREESYLLSGEVVSSLQIDFETTKEPISKIVRRGTKRWQYMICSDGGWMFYNEEQFKDKNIGFTHASEDACAKNGKGAAVALADAPSYSSSTVSPYSESDRGGLTDNYVRTMEIIAGQEQELRDNYINSVSPTEPFTSSIDYNPFADWEDRQEAEKQARAAAENTCRGKAERARESARRQLGAMGAGSEQLTVPQEAYEATYHSCMRDYGY